MTFFDDPPPDDCTVMLALLREAGRAGEHGSEVESAMERMPRTEYVDELGTPLPPAEPVVLERRFQRALRDLLMAGLLEARENGRFVMTERGRRVLNENPNGVDGSVLMRFPEYRRFLANLEQPVETHPPGEGAAYAEGMAAYNKGLRQTEKPYDLDTLSHLAWDAGWFEAFDEDMRPDG